MGASAVFYAMLINCISEKNACFSCYRENLSAVLLETVLFCCVLMFFLVCFWLLLYAFNVRPFSPPTNFFFFCWMHMFFVHCSIIICLILCIASFGPKKHLWFRAFFFSPCSIFSCLLHPSFFSELHVEQDWPGCLLPHVERQGPIVAHYRRWLSSDNAHVGTHCRAW